MSYVESGAPSSSSIRCATETATFPINECLARIRSDDPAAARELIEFLRPCILSIVRRRLPRRVHEDDLIQEILLKVFTHLDQYQGRVPFQHWVSRIALTTCLNQIRTQRRRPEYRFADFSDREVDLINASLPDENCVSPDDVVMKEDLLNELLKRIPPEQQLIIKLLELEQCSTLEISKKTGWSRSLVKVRAHRARLALRRIFLELETDVTRGAESLGAVFERTPVSL